MIAQHAVTLETQVVAAPARSGKVYYRPELDALRFFAFLCVFFCHWLAYLPLDPMKDIWFVRIRTIGAFGVPVFFLLSAFLITELLLRERERTGKVHIPSFYMRRILRIWPLYFVAFFGLTVLNHFLPGVGSRNWHAWLAFSLFAGNWYVSHHGWIEGPVGPLWTVSIEEQFYIAIPILVALGGRRALVCTSYVLLAIAYMTVVLYGMNPPPGDNAEWTNSFVQFQFFSAGTLIAIYLRGRLITLDLPLRIAGFAVGFAFWFVAVIRFHVQSLTPQLTPAGSMGGWAFVLAGSITFFLCTLGTSSRYIPSWLAYLGRISYGLYVVHALILFLILTKFLPYLNLLLHRQIFSAATEELLGALLALALSSFVAHLSYKYFETPFLQLKKRFSW